MYWTKIIKATTKIKVIKSLENRIRLLLGLKLKTTRVLKFRRKNINWNNSIRKLDDTIRISSL